MSTIGENLDRIKGFPKFSCPGQMWKLDIFPLSSIPQSEIRSLAWHCNVIMLYIMQIELENIFLKFQTQDSLGGGGGDVYCQPGTCKIQIYLVYLQIVLVSPCHVPPTSYLYTSNVCCQMKNILVSLVQLYLPSTPDCATLAVITISVQMC